jgi:ATP-dependent exoDNAse (exonuclease V) beta subunit
MERVIANIPDRSARLRVLKDLNSTLLVEAGAGTGKTALMAGRVVMLLASGVPPRDVVAITFTEAAASDLFVRVTEYVQGLLAGKIPDELKIAFENGLTTSQLEFLKRGADSFDELTCSTIHSFCQQITRPYPVEASLDPGAVVMDDKQATVSWERLFEQWLRQKLDDAPADDPVAWLLIEEREHGRNFIEQIATAQQERRNAGCTQRELGADLLANFGLAVDQFQDAVRRAAEDGLIEEGSTQYAEALGQLAAAYSLTLDRPIPFPDLWRMCWPQRSVKSADTIFTKNGSLRKYRVKGAWRTAAKAAGKPLGLGERFNEEATAAYNRIQETLEALLDALGEVALSRIVLAVEKFRELYQEHKLASAVLDFDDLLINARDLLRNSTEVRSALAKRYRFILVDEFQDTDPIQAEILFLLCGEGPAEAPWWELRLRPGQLFVVGDPKQSIYRFRRADIACYQQVREALLTQFPDSKVEITANFRSQWPILDFVNTRFAERFVDIGFAPLFCTVNEPQPANPLVARIGVDYSAEAGTDDRRRAEALQVAQYCRSLLGEFPVRNGKALVPCQPKHIALLAPSGTELWTYEQALEDLGIPLSTQAGKGLFWRQEIQDLIAVTRVLSNRRDSLALGALLRGPLVGLSEEELLDIVAELPRDPETGEFAFVTIDTDPEGITHPVARETLIILRDLVRKAYNATPFDVLSAAVERLRVRPMLKLRYPHHPERALANVDLFLELSRQYSVRGLREFARDMMRRWKDAERQIEGRADAGADAVQIVTLHTAKGLEWPVVIPINMLTRPRGASGVLFDSRNQVLLCKYDPVRTPAYDALQTEENEQLRRERLRMWYVCCTRARDLLVIPHHVNVNAGASWFGEVDLRLAELPLVASQRQEPYNRPPMKGQNRQTLEVFEQEANTLAKSSLRISWTKPSAADPDKRSESATGGLAEPLVVTNPEQNSVTGSALRGQILHKMMEEVLLGSIDRSLESLTSRARELFAQLSLHDSRDPQSGVSSEEVCETIIRTLSLPLVQQYRRKLIPEWNLFSSVQREESNWEAAYGIADAIAYDDGGGPEIIFDWKSDVAPEPAVHKKHVAQLRTYLEMARCPRGAVVYMTTGDVYEIAIGPQQPSPPSISG